MDLSAPSWDLFIILFFVITVGYGFLIQAERIIVTLIAAYLGLLLTNLFAGDVLGFFHGDNPLFGKYFIRAGFSATQVQLGIFFMTLALVSHKSGLDVARGNKRWSPLELLIISALTATLILSTVFGYLPTEQVTILAGQSELVATILEYHDLWLIAPLAFLIFLGFRKGVSPE